MGVGARGVSRYRSVAIVAAVITTLAATLFRMAIDPWAGTAIPFVTYFLASLLLAWYFGFWPATLCTLLGAIVGTHYFLHQGQEPVTFWGRTEAAAIVGYVLATLFASSLIAVQRKVLARVKAAEQAQAAVAKENADLLEKARRAQEELQRSNEELRRANRDLETFTYSASHDLKEPLRNIAVYAQLLEKESRLYLPPPAADFLDYIITSARRMTTIMDDLLLYAQATKHDAGPILSVDANSVLAGVLGDLQEQIRDQGATVTAETLPVVAVHRSSLAQIFQNLISNGIKYRRAEAPVIHVAARARNGFSIFSVTDNGLGIEEEYRKEIFGLFKRLHGRDLPGNGMGLAICQRLVEHYGGEIWVEASELGKGSTLCFSVPTADASDDIAVRTAGAGSVASAVRR